MHCLPRLQFLYAGFLVATILLPARVAQCQLDAQLENQFASSVRPVLVEFCFECHSGDQTEAEIDLGLYHSADDARRDVKLWQKVRRILDSRQMPPKDAAQPSDAQRQILQRWVRDFLLQQARATAGDPGPVVLRRLSNDEYDYTLGDLTGLTSLHLTQEFPVDGAAGEGFTNSGEGQAMSPSLVVKYLDAAKALATHAVLTPSGISFSPYQTRRDWTDERVATIRDFYERFTVSSQMQADVGGAGKVPNGGGTVPLAEYITATLAERDTLTDGSRTIEQVARQRNLNPIYLGALWKSLSAPSSSLLLQGLSDQWKDAAPTATPQLVSMIQQLQQTLFQYNPIGHIGPDGKPKIWMEAANPTTTQRQFEVALPDQPNENVSIFLAASDAGDGNTGDYVVWKNPRLVTPNRPDIPLRLLVGLQERLVAGQRQVLSHTRDYLTAVADLQAQPMPATTDDLTRVATQSQLDPSVLRAWADLLHIGPGDAVTVRGHFEESEVNATYDFIRIWGTGATPNIGANASDQQVRIPGIANPGKVFAHPSPTLFAAVGWQSPITGRLKIEASIADAHPECGSGQEWFLQHRTDRRTNNLWKGAFGTRGSAKLDPLEVDVRAGELISFILGPGREYSCDLTEMNLTITELEGQQRRWDLAQDVSADILASNPHADSYGNATTWHFYKGEIKDVFRGERFVNAIAPGSLLSQWIHSSDAGERTQLAEQVHALVNGEPPADVNSLNGKLYVQLNALPFATHDLESLLDEVPADDRFGQHPLGADIASTDLVIHAPAVVEFRALANLVAGRTLIVDAELDQARASQGTVRVEVGLERIEPSSIGFSSPILTTEGGPAQQRVLAALEEFRKLFPPHFCYTQIVPVDEVVTSTLFYRQDEALQRLLLQPSEVDELDRLWDELMFVAQEPLQYEVAFEQIRAFATQDRADLVKIWDPLKESVIARADQFRLRLLDTESIHVGALLEIASRAWRRPLTPSDQQGLRNLYQSLRADELDHEAAVRLTLARILTSPNFLYRREAQPAGSQPQPVSGFDLASRLSYFLWSSLPDESLRAAAQDGALLRDDVLVQQTRRMLNDPRARRLAVQFACQWLHVRNFDQNDDKNEALYPEFAELRRDMYEETVRFFEDMIRNDGSMLDLLGADHTFLNERLANHYGIAGVTGAEWQRVNDLKEQGRGGVLGMATVLASQSGASRTSPILRGNWIYETLLGERLPRPPPNVPQLPEQVPSGLTARQLIEKHSSVPECATCHVLIDPYGFALEQFDAIGRRRTGEVDTSTTLVDGLQVDGLEGLRKYLLTQRREDVLRQFCRKLLGFALGREVQLSDEILLEDMLARLRDHEYRFGIAVETIVTSKQFRQIRGADFVLE